MFRKSYPTQLSLLIIGIAIMSALATHFRWYYHFKDLDMPMHFAGGFWVGATTLWVYFFWSRFNVVSSEKRTVKHVLAIALLGALSIGLVWELYEFGVDMATGVRTWSALDTGSDLLFDIFGACAAAGYFLRRNYHRA